MAELKHYGIIRRSGRYPWGSGGAAYQRNKSFLGTVKELEEQGLSEIDIAKGLGISIKKLRERQSVAKNAVRMANVAMAIRLKEKGYSDTAIGERMGLNESSVRSLLNPASLERGKILENVSYVLSESAKKKTYIDVGAGTETHLGVSRTKLDTAVSLLQDQGYKVFYVRARQQGNDKVTKMKVLAPPGTEYPKGELKFQIKTAFDHYLIDGGRSVRGIEEPSQVSSDRIHIRYKEEGGDLRDGLIEVRRGVDDLSLGNAKYAQVRIGVDGKYFMKGMVVYSDNIPPGKDVIYNSNKPKGSPPEKVFKPNETDPDNPFGSTVRQKKYTDESGKEKLSALNIINEEGDWKDWKNALSSQVLSKQSPALAKRQLGFVLKKQLDEFDEINNLTNPEVKKRLLQTFSDECDSAAVHLKAASLPRQRTAVILPFVTIKENEIYAPNHRHGELVALIRHPHGGIFEIPELIVNNRNKEAASVLKQAIDAVGINPKVAARLSGADFDGDNVLVIPQKAGLIKTSSPLQGLKDFDPRASYKPYEGMTTVDGGVYRNGKVDYGNGKPKKQNMQHKMGDISNLITDMTIKGANNDEIARAVRHSMVVIDSEKHSLNFAQSYLDNGIAALKKKYQGSEKAGASTLISRASSEERVPYREEGKWVTDPKTGKAKRVYIDPDTGRKLYETTGETYTNKQGKLVERTTKSTKMFEREDARDLISTDRTRIETIYAEHANSLKALANKARKTMLETEDLEYSPSARKVYEQEVKTLNAKLAQALRAKPLERQAQLLAGKEIAIKKNENPDLDKDELKKIKGQALEEARRRTGSKKVPVEINDKEWEAIQAGAITKSLLNQILLNTDLDAIKNRATPRTTYKMTDTKMARGKAMLASGYDTEEVAAALGVSVSTIQETLLK